jgi:hypothetical protein
MRREAIRVQGRRRPAVKAKSICSCRNSSAISSDAAVLPWTTSVSSDWRPRTAGFRWAKRTSAPLLLVRRCVAWRPVVPRPLHRHPVGWTGFHGEWVCRFDSVIEPCSAPWSGESFVVGSWFGERASVRAADVGLLEVADGRGRSAQGRFGAGGLEAARCKPVCGPRREDRDRSVG